MCSNKYHLSWGGVGVLQKLYLQLKKKKQNHETSSKLTMEAFWKEIVSMCFRSKDTPRGLCHCLQSQATVRRVLAL